MEVGSVLTPPPETNSESDALLKSSGRRAGDLAAILNRLQVQTVPASLPKPWAFLGATGSTRKLCGEPVDLVASLQAEFSIEQLLDARVVERTSNNQLRLSPIFGNATASFVIRHDAAHLPIDVISSRGVLSSSAPEWIQLATKSADGASGHGQPVLLAFDDVELLLFHRLGCRFTSAAKLEFLDGDCVRALIAGRAKRRQQRRYTLTFSGWQMAEGIYQPTPTLVRTLEHIVQIRSHFQFDPATVFDVWMPTPDEFRAIGSALSFRDRRVVWEACTTSLTKSRFTPAAALRLIRDRTKTDYGTARRSLVREIERSGFAPRCAETSVALARAHKSFCTSVTAPMLGCSDTKYDTWEQLRMFMGAALAEEWFEASEEVAAAKKIIAGEYPDRREMDERHAQRMRLVDKFVKLYRCGVNR